MYINMQKLVIEIEIYNKILEEYEEIKKLAALVGIKHYQIGPLVRSSYNAANLI